MMKKLLEIITHASPVLLMVAIIPLIHNDYYLSLAYLVIIMLFLFVGQRKPEITVFFFGLIVMTLSELFFIHSGVETFNRTSLFGVMPIWLPLLWAYGFVAIKRGISVLEH